ncbi:hypothetical protein [Pseudonocardia parietis]|uniref:Membrane protein n=1 Tax=Pseudonocardia parietis TaxID=570936 RepID=A0ABS4W235_9PSEU|nr:hypothetical protein [Pseudonocardia parietis]MBP2370259.1 putative membrane protein [Pseudonocardia parietis]
MITLVEGVMIIGFPPVAYWIGSAGVRRSHTRMRGCTNPLHKAEASQRAALMQMRVTAETVWFSALLIVWALMPAPASIGAAVVSSLLLLALSFAGVVATGLWAWRRRRAIGLTESLCS